MRAPDHMPMPMREMDVKPQQLNRKDVLIKNPVFGKEYLTRIQALEAISNIAEMMKLDERTRC